MDVGSADSGWFYSKRGAPAGQQAGPFTWQQLASLAQTGSIAPDDLVWNPQSAEWQPAAQIPGFLPTSPFPGYGYPAPSGYASARPSRSRLLAWLIPLVVVILAGGGLGGYFAARHGGGNSSGTTLAAGAAGSAGSSGSSTSSSAPAAAVTSSSSSTSSSTTSSTEPPFVQQEDEILLEPSGTAGPDSYTGETFVVVGPTTTLSIPTTVTLPTPSTSTTPTTSTTPSQSTTTAAPDAGASLLAYPGDTPALYGGSKSKKQVDKEGQLRFFEQNPDKAAAFCAALNSDPTFRWSGGKQIRPDQLRDYFAELTPLVLTRDTRVTNYGYRDGRPTPRQSVLQAGQIVLVDRYGVPRVRCECGNPLTPPKPVRKTPKYTGPRWGGFNPTTIIVIQQTTVVINIFVVVDVDTGKPFERPPGTEGGQDTVRTATVWQLDVQTDDGASNPVKFTATVTLNPDGTLSGSGKGTYSVPNGTTTDKKTKAKTGTLVAEASFTVSIGGTADTTELGRTLKIKPALGELTVTKAVYHTTSPEAQLRAALPGDMSSWLQPALVELDLQAADYGPVMATLASKSGAQGSAVLTPVK
jgi:hypothetical protein